MIAKDLHAENFLPLVKYIVGRMQVKLPPFIDSEDLIAYGVFGLLEAIDRFDETRGIKFETFATPRIRGAILDAIRKANWAPRSVYAQLRLYQKTVQKLEQKYGNKVNDDLIAKELNITTEEINKFMMNINYLSIDSLDNFLFNKDDDSLTLSNIVEDEKSPNPEKIYEEKEIKDLLVKAIQNLNEKDQLLLNLYYYEGLTLKEIGKILGVSESRVCQLHSRALLRLKNALNKIGIGA